ncbi:hypothetical protein [Tautonia marina]|uniref:hypothetical protein n=1 Tax=Tautonia marina TaxID=2653855 RepID=UPI0012610D2D|nr:hypothetical protein [Tautonia marina]
MPPRESGPQRRARLAAEGRYGELLAELERSCPSLIDAEELWDQILQASRVRAQDDPAAFGRAVLDETTGFVNYLVLRSHHALQARLAAHDRASRDHGLTGPPPELQDRSLEPLMKLQSHQAALLEARAKLQRRWQLVEPESGALSRSTQNHPQGDLADEVQPLTDSFEDDGPDEDLGMVAAPHHDDGPEPLLDDEDRPHQANGHHLLEGRNGHDAIEIPVDDLPSRHNGAFTNGSHLDLPIWRRHRFRFGSGGSKGQGRSKRRR